MYARIGDRTRQIEWKWVTWNHDLFVCLFCSSSFIRNSGGGPSLDDIAYTMTPRGTRQVCIVICLNHRCCFNDDDDTQWQMSLRFDSAEALAACIDLLNGYYNHLHMDPLVTIRTKETLKIFVVTIKLFFFQIANSSTPASPRALNGGSKDVRPEVYFPPTQVANFLKIDEISLLHCLIFVRSVPSLMSRRRDSICFDLVMICSACCRCIVFFF